MDLTLSRPPRDVSLGTIHCNEKNSYNCFRREEERPWARGVDRLQTESGGNWVGDPQFASTGMHKV